MLYAARDTILKMNFSMEVKLIFENVSIYILNGPGGIRTHDHLVKSQMLYLSELRAPRPNKIVKYKDC